MTDGISTTVYTYNGDGDRVKQTVNGVQTTYVLDTALGLTQVLSETTGLNTIHYLHGLDLIAESDGSSTDYFAYDGLGSVRQLTDSSAGVLLTQTFDPYGNLYASAGTSQSAFGFTGEMQDSNGLLFLRARYYNPGQGRFLNLDPSRLERNPYQYSLSNPVNFTDPSGQQCAGCRTPGDFAQFVLFYQYGIVLTTELTRGFSDEEKALIHETVTDYAQILGGSQTFRNNVALDEIRETWVRNSSNFNAEYFPLNNTIALPPNWFKEILANDPSGSFFIITGPPCVDNLLGFPEGTLPSTRIGAQFVLAHEIGHGFAKGNQAVFEDFKDKVFTPRRPFGQAKSNPIFQRNRGRDRVEIFADVIASYLYAPSLLEEDMIEWVERHMPAALK